MSTLFLFQNNASSTLASAITNSQTTATVAAGKGSLFPSPGAGQQIALTFEDVSGNIEVAYCTARTGDTFTIVRGQEGTSPLAFASGSVVEMRVTSGLLASFLQKTGGDTLSGTTAMTGVLNLGSGGSIQGGEFTGALRSGPGVTSNQIVVPSGLPATSGGSTILTAANINSNLPSNLAVIQTGMILLWSGSSSSVPSGFNICDGTNGTPDLRDQFVLGAGGSLASSGGSTTTTTGVAGALSGYSTDGHVLTAAELPSTGSGATLPFTFINIGQASGGSGTGNVLVTGNTSSSTLPLHGASSTAHSHTLTSIPGHQHSYTYPAYKALYYIMKL